MIRDSKPVSMVVMMDLYINMILTFRRCVCSLGRILCLFVFVFVFFLCFLFVCRFLLFFSLLIWGELDV